MWLRQILCFVGIFFAEGTSLFGKYFHSKSLNYAEETSADFSVHPDYGLDVVSITENSVVLICLKIQ